MSNSWNLLKVIGTLCDAAAPHSPWQKSTRVRQIGRRFLEKASFSRKKTSSTSHRQASIVKNIDRPRRVTAMFPPNHAAERTGISGETIERLAVEFASTDHAVVYGRLGVSTQLHGGVCQWLINAMNLVTGSNNSWMHRFKRLTRGPNRCTLQMHPGDAKQLGLRAGERVVVKSRVGEISIPLETSDSIMPGVVSIPHGYGHHRGSEESPAVGELNGVSVNDITDDQIVDSLTGNAALSSQRVVVARATGA